MALDSANIWVSRTCQVNLSVWKLLFSKKEKTHLIHRAIDYF